MGSVLVRTPVWDLESSLFWTLFSSQPISWFFQSSLPTDDLTAANRVVAPPERIAWHCYSTIRREERAECAGLRIRTRGNKSDVPSNLRHLVSCLRLAAYWLLRQVCCAYCWYLGIIYFKRDIIFVVQDNNHIKNLKSYFQQNREIYILA